MRPQYRQMNPAQEIQPFGYIALVYCGFSMISNFVRD
jgi:hypothetical protein